MPYQEQQRQEAMQRYLSGESISSICRDFKRSRKWFYKWQKRYESGNPYWYKVESREPREKPRKIAPEVEETIIQVRRKLKQDKYARIGPQMIDWELRRLGYDPPPCLSTIKRVIRRNKLVTRLERYEKKGTTYPQIPPLFPNTIHQIDFWGPRYIKGDGRFHSLNVMDIYTRRVSTYPARRKRTQEALEGINTVWKLMGAPEFMQFDNTLAFRGSNRYPRSFGPVIKWCLRHRIQPVFIPFGEPWRNSHLEKFHHTLEKQFFRRINFNSFTNLVQEIEGFKTYHNQHYRYSPLNGYTLEEVYERDRICPDASLGTDFSMDEDIPLEDGYIHLIRFIRSDRKLNIFGETFPVPKELEYEYVVATICTDNHFIRVHDNQWKSLFTIPNSHRQFVTYVLALKGF